MYLTQRMWHHVPAQFQRLTAFAIIAALAFSIGWAAGTYGPAAYTFLTTNRMPTTAVVASQSQQYLLGGHGELAAGASNAQAALRITAASPALIGSGSAYDGQSYRSPQIAPNVLAIGTGSAYDGR